jgi:hypothetical protein
LIRIYANLAHDSMNGFIGFTETLPSWLSVINGALQWFLSFNWNFVSLCLMFLLTWNVLLCPIATVVLYRVRSQVVTSSSADNIYNSQPITEHFLKTTPGTKSPFLWKTGLTTDVLLIKGHGKCTPSLSNINRQQNMAR